MVPERWRQIEQVLDGALDRAPAERGAFLDQACARDDELRREVEALLVNESKADAFIERPAFELLAPILAHEPASAQPGQQIGHFQILSLLGAGGMGQVYLAQDTQLGRKVALKFLPQEFMQDPKRVQRFKQEARAASMK